MEKENNSNSPINQKRDQGHIVDDCSDAPVYSKNYSLPFTE